MLQGAHSLPRVRRHRNSQGPTAAQILSLLPPGQLIWVLPSTPLASQTSLHSQLPTAGPGATRVAMTPLQVLQVQLTHCQSSKRAAALGALPGHGNWHIRTLSHIWEVSAMLSSARLRNGFSLYCLVSVSPLRTTFPIFKCPGQGRCHSQPCLTPQHQCSSVHTSERPPRCPLSPPAPRMAV